MKTSVKNGLLYGVISCVFTLLLFVTGMNRSDSTWIFQLIGLIIPVILIRMTLAEVRDKEGNGYITFGKAFKEGMTVVAIGALIIATFSVIYTKVIDPGLMDYVMSKQVEKFDEMGMSEEQIEQAINNTAKFSTPVWQFTFGLLGSLFIGAIIALIMAAVMKKNDPEYIG